MRLDERYACIALAHMGAFHPTMGRAYMELMLGEPVTIERFWQLVHEFNRESPDNNVGRDRMRENVG